MSGEEEFARNRPMLIEYVLNNERKRLGGKGMSDDERKWRAQWVKDQILHSSEPNRSIRPNELVDENVARWQNLFRNPIRRLYRAPWDGIQLLLNPLLGPARAKTIRYYVPKYFIMIGIVYAFHYYFKYHQNTWEREGGWRVWTVRPKNWPDEPDFPRASPREGPADYADRGFKKRSALLD